MHMADSLCCTTESNSILKQLYSNKDLLKKKKRKTYLEQRYGGENKYESMMPGETDIFLGVT